MNTYGLRGILTAAFLIMLSTAICSKSNAQVVATWTGGGDGTRYSDPANWNIGIVPINGTTNYNVVVPTGRNIIFDAPGSISGISYGSGGSITVASGVAFNVNSVASLNSNIIADGAGTSFTANGIGVALGQNVRSVATNGGRVSTSATQYTVGTSSSFNAFHANGNGSVVNASALSTITNSSPTGVTTVNSNKHFIAENGGTLDFSNLQTVFGGGFAQTGPQNNIFTARTGGIMHLDSLQEVFNNNVFNIEIENFSFPSLSTAQGATFNIASGTNVLAPTLTSAISTTFNFSDNSVFYSPNLTDIRNSTISLRPSMQFSTGQLTSIDNSRLTVLDGASLTIAATSYTTNLSGSINSFHADGAGSLIDASSLSTISNTSPTGVTTVASNKHFTAENGGVLDFSNLQTIFGGGFAQTGPQNNVFTVRSGGEIKLDNLRSIFNNNVFNVDMPIFAMPSLTTAHGATFSLSVGTTIQTPSLSVIDSSNIAMPIFSAWNADNLVEMVNSNLSMEVGSNFNAPNLSSFKNSSITLSPGIGFTTALLTDVTNSRIAMAGGGQLALGASDYINSRNANDTAFRADGINSEISAPGMTSISKTSGGTTSFIAENRGKLDFSSVDNITGGPSSNNAFIARTGGRIELGEGNITRRNAFSIDGSGSAISFTSLDLNLQSTFSATNLGTLELSGSLSHVHTTEANFNFDNGRVHFRGTPLAQLEIAGENKGLSNNGLGNFGFQQLRVGTASSPTTLILADNVNNGNRVNGMREVQYLLDVSGDGLVFSNGSGIVLNGHDMFVSNGQDSFFSVRDLIAPGQISVAYGGGFISLTGEIGHIINGDFEAWKPGPGDDIFTRDLIGIKREGVGTIRGIRFPRFGNDDNTVMEMIAGSPVEAFQFVSTPADDFRIQLEALALQEDGTLSLLLDDMVLQSWDWSELGSSDFTKMTFLANNQSFQGLTDVRLSLMWDGNSGSSVYIDNWRITAVPEPSSVVALVATGLGGILLRRRKLRRDSGVVRSPV